MGCQLQNNQDQYEQIIILCKKMVMLKSDIEYLTLTPFEKDMEFEMLCEKGEEPIFSARFLEASIMKTWLEPWVRSSLNLKKSSLFPSA